MTYRPIRTIGLLAALAAAVLTPQVASAATGTAAAALPAHHPVFMPQVGEAPLPPIPTPPVCCLPAVGVAFGQPTMGNMVYFGGHVQVHPKIYLVLWGWGEKGAFDHTPAGMPASDPDGAAKRMIDFLSNVGGSAWAGVSTQYYQTVGGHNEYIHNDPHLLKGVWWDNTDPIQNNLGCKDMACSELKIAQEATRAARRLHVTDLANSDIVVAQPQKYNDWGFSNPIGGVFGYCAYHDYTGTTTNHPAWVTSNAHVQSGLSFTNMPYILNQGASCGQSSVNSGASGKLDGVSIVLGHEVEETITDPGAEEVGGPGCSANTVGAGGINVWSIQAGCQYLGGWYDLQQFENGDKCAWVGDTGATAPSSFPGGLNNIKATNGAKYPVQSLWSNAAAGGAGYCAGAGDDLPG